MWVFAKLLLSVVWGSLVGKLAIGGLAAFIALKGYGLYHYKRGERDLAVKIEQKAEKDERLAEAVRSDAVTNVGKRVRRDPSHRARD